MDVHVALPTSRSDAVEEPVPVVILELWRYARPLACPSHKRGIGRLYTLILFLAASVSFPARAEDLPPATVVRLDATGEAGEEQGRALAEVAHQETQSVWSEEHVGAIRSIPSDLAPVTALVAQLERLYFEADFLECLALLQRGELRSEDLLARGQRELASRVLAFGSACALGAEDTTSAERLIEAAIVADLPLTSLSTMSSEFQRFVQPVLHRTQEGASIPIAIRSNPPGASLSLDGTRTCDVTPCEIRVRPGRHVFVLTKLGFAARIVTAGVSATSVPDLAFSLDPSNAAEFREQLADALARQATDAEELVSSAAAARAATDAFSSRAVLFVRRAPAGASGAIYDRGLDRFVGRVALEGPNADRDVVRFLSREWRGVLRPTPLYEEPWFWVLVAVGAGAIATTTYVVAQPPTIEYQLGGR